MTIRFEIPPNIERILRDSGSNLARDAKETYLVEQYRREFLTIFDLEHALDFDRLEVMALLKHHAVFNGTITHEEVDADLVNARRLFDESRP